MLVLTRKAQQKIRIGKDIVITVLKVHKDQVSIGLEAPKSLKIIRDELVDEALVEKVAEKNQESSHSR